MCTHESISTAPRSSSRRRRLWELPSHAFCPVIGVCVPIRALRRLADKVLGGQAIADDYDLHCGVIADCRQRTRMAEAIQRELDQRYVLPLRRAWAAKTTDALAQWWRESLAGSDVAGALWSTLSHPRCDAALEEQVLRDVHLLQHQVGAANRASLQRLSELIDENRVLAGELAAAQKRTTQAAIEQRRRIEDLQSQSVRLRAELMRRQTALAAAADDLATLEAAIPALKERAELARALDQQTARVHELERQLLRRQHEAERATARAEEAERALRQHREEQREVRPTAALPRLDDRAVLCVGGRQASVPVYRRVIEAVGGRFLHHDGGSEDNANQLDATLESADLVICQTGCISHDAYWRVKDYCKRTGKRCLFVEKPSRASLQRALTSLTQTAPSQAVIPIFPADA